MNEQSPQKPMKRKTGHISVDLRPITLYRDDIEGLFSALGKSGDRPVIEAADYEFDDVAELGNLGREVVHELEVKSNEPFIRVNFRTTSARLYASRTDIHSRGLIEQMREIVEPRQRSFSRLTHSAIWPFVPITLGSSSLLPAAR